MPPKKKPVGAPKKRGRKPLLKNIKAKEEIEEPASDDKQDTSNSDESNPNPQINKDAEEEKPDEVSIPEVKDDDIKKEEKEESVPAINKTSFHKKFGKFHFLDEPSVKIEEPNCSKSESDESQHEMMLNMESVEHIENIIGVVIAPNAIANYTIVPAIEDDVEINSHIETVECSQDSEEQEHAITDKLASLAVESENKNESEAMEVCDENSVEQSLEEENSNSKSPKASEEVINENESEFFTECVNEEVVLVEEATLEETEDKNESKTMEDESTKKDDENKEKTTSLKKKADVIRPSLRKDDQKLMRIRKEKDKPKVEKLQQTKKTLKKGPQPKKEKQDPAKKVLEKQNSDASESSTNSENSIRRSSRIKSISVLKQKSKGHGLVKPIIETSESSSNGNDVDKVSSPLDSPNFTAPGTESELKPVKVKSRWRRTSELEMNNTPLVSKCGSPVIVNNNDNSVLPGDNHVISEKEKAENDAEVQRRLKQFLHLKDNIYLTERISCKEAKKMTCDCFLTQEEIERGEYGCGEDCLNRLLMIECGPLCSVGDRCTNKRFQKGAFSPCEVFNTKTKGLGIRATANIPFGEFIMEYVGEVLDPDEFEKRANEYSKDKNQHYYFMSLRGDAIIDATFKGNISRFINHSCDPNAETQKWTVNGELRIGFFSKKLILAGEEITFDYHFQRYGKEAQKCYCGSPICRGWLGEEPDEDDEDDDEEEDEDEEEEEEEEEKDEVKKEDVKVEEKVSDSLDVSETDSKDPEKLDATEASVEKLEEEIVKPEIKKKEKKKVLRAKKPRKDILYTFDNLDLDEEIETLLTTGLKNQAHTLKLSRLMVRAKELSQRTKLLSLLKDGELPCRRLFLDYHGLRLIHGWMMDIKLETLKLEILKTLQSLPISNKTMLQDSKVLTTVEKWSKNEEGEESPMDDSNSPKPELAETAPPQPEIEKKVEKEEPNENSQDDMDISPIYDDKENVLDVNKDTKSSVREEIVVLALKLLEDWKNLKEIFRIPKRERIEQMKEHEREADRKYKAGLGLELDEERKAESRYRALQRFGRIEKIPELDRTRRGRPDEKLVPKLSKHERRKLFALKVEQEEEEKRRQREFWQQHEQRCLNMGTDPRLTAPFDPNRGYHCIWNPQTGQWQPILPNPNAAQGLIVPASQNSILGQPSFQIPQASPFMHTPPPFPGGQNMIMHHSPQFKHIPHASPNMVRPGVPMNLPNMNIPQNVNITLPNINVATQLPPPNVSSMANNQHIATPFTAFANSPIVSNLPPVSANLHGVPAISNPLYTPTKSNEKDEFIQVKFMGPIPPPVKLPPKWKCAKDKYGRPYYYHIKIRKAQWEPPNFPLQGVDKVSDSDSSSETSSLSSDSSSDDSDDEIDDNQLLRNIRNKFEQMDQEASGVPVEVDKEKEALIDLLSGTGEEEKKRERPAKKRRVGLVQEIIISPRTEEDRLQFKEDLKRYKENKEQLKREKEMLLIAEKQRQADAANASYSRSKLRKEKSKTHVKPKPKDAAPISSEAARKIKDKFRASMATVMVNILNPYRKPDCPQGRITSTEDFKHLARKLTHFVMLKELKHISSIEDLTCNESVKSKAKEFVRKYMSKFKTEYHRDDVETTTMTTTTTTTNSTTTEQPSTK